MFCAYVQITDISSKDSNVSLFKYPNAGFILIFTHFSHKHLKQHYQQYLEVKKKIAPNAQKYQDSESRRALSTMRAFSFLARTQAQDDKFLQPVVYATSK